MTNSATETTTGVIFESIIIRTERNSTEVDIARVTTDIDIYEHIDKPYLTAVLGFADTSDIVGSLDIIGGEQVDITLKSSRKNTISVSKTFYIDKILSSTKGNQNSEYIIFHLIEDIGYISNLQNINKSYEGKCSEIISKVSKQYLNKDVNTANNDFQQIKTIVPNLNPMETMIWLKKRATTNKGYPFYLFSTLTQDELYFADLETMVGSNPINPDIPFSYNGGNVLSQDNISGTDTAKRRTIISYTYNDVENLLGLIKSGVVGSRYDYYNITENAKYQVDFDLMSDAIEPFYKGNNLKGEPTFSDLFEFNGKSYNQLQTKHVTQIGTTQPYENFNSYHQGSTVGDYRFNVISKAMDHLIKKNPLSITVNGIDFLDGDRHSTIGNKIQVKFLRNVTDHNISDRKFDTKKSGNYLIFATKHSFKLDSYHTTLSCLKLTSGEIQ